MTANYLSSKNIVSHRLTQGYNTIWKDNLLWLEKFSMGRLPRHILEAPLELLCWNCSFVEEKQSPESSSR